MTRDEQIAAALDAARAAAAALREHGLAVPDADLALVAVGEDAEGTYVLLVEPRPTSARSSLGLAQGLDEALGALDRPVV